MFLGSWFWILLVFVPLCLCRTMLTKDAKPAEKQGKEAVQVIPPRPDTPKMFQAALKVTEISGIEGTMAKLRQTYKQSEDTEVRKVLLQVLLLVSCSSMMQHDDLLHLIDLEGLLLLV